MDPSKVRHHIWFDKWKQDCEDRWPVHTGVGCLAGKTLKKGSFQNNLSEQKTSDNITSENET